MRILTHRSFLFLLFHQIHLRVDHGLDQVTFEQATHGRRDRPIVPHVIQRAFTRGRRGLWPQSLLILVDRFERRIHRIWHGPLADRPTVPRFVHPRHDDLRSGLFHLLPFGQRRYSLFHAHLIPLPARIFAWVDAISRDSFFEPLRTSVQLHDRFGQWPKIRLISRDGLVGHRVCLETKLHRVWLVLRLKLPIVARRRLLFPG